MSADTDAVRVLAKHAQSLKKELSAADQSDLFGVAVEAGCLAAFSDLEIDAAEKQAILAAASALSEGDVVEWEADALVDECAARIAKEGIEARVAAVGASLKKLGRAEAGLALAALVAHASAGVDRVEHGVLEAIAEAAGVGADKLAALVKQATG